MELKRQISNIIINVNEENNEDWCTNIEFEGGRVSVEDNIIKAYKNHKFYVYKLEDFALKPRTIISMIQRFIKGN